MSLFQNAMLHKIHNEKLNEKISEVERETPILNTPQHKLNSPKERIKTTMARNKSMDNFMKFTWSWTI